MGNELNRFLDAYKEALKGYLNDTKVYAAGFPALISATTNDVLYAYDEQERDNRQHCLIVDRKVINTSLGYPKPALETTDLLKNKYLTEDGYSDDKYTITKECIQNHNIRLCHPYEIIMEMCRLIDSGQSFECRFPVAVKYNDDFEIIERCKKENLLALDFRRISYEKGDFFIIDIKIDDKTTVSSAFLSLDEIPDTLNKIEQGIYEIHCKSIADIIEDNKNKTKGKAKSKGAERDD